MKTNILSRLKTAVASLLLAGVFSLGLCGCETLSSLWNRPETQESVTGLKKAAWSFAYAAAAETARQVASGQTVDMPKVAMVGGAAALWTSASYIRQLQATKSVLDAQATAKQLEAAGIPPDQAGQLAGVITSNAQTLVAKGVDPNVASEINAAAFDAAAKAIQERASDQAP